MLSGILASQLSSSSDGGDATTTVGGGRLCSDAVRLSEHLSARPVYVSAGRSAYHQYEMLTRAPFAAPDPLQRFRADVDAILGPYFGHLHVQTAAAVLGPLSIFIRWDRLFHLPGDLQLGSLNRQS